VIRDAVTTLRPDSGNDQPRTALEDLVDRPFSALG
jgi:hypothetical protein